MSMRRRTLLKVIVLGDSGCVRPFSISVSRAFPLFTNFFCYVNYLYNLMGYCQCQGWQDVVDESVSFKTLIEFFFSFFGF